jgi:hypothetical protein
MEAAFKSELAEVFGVEDEDSLPDALQVMLAKKYVGLGIEHDVLPRCHCASGTGFQRCHGGRRRLRGSGRMAGKRLSF